MSTFLQLCSKLREKTIDSGTGPAAVTGQTGQLARLESAVSDGSVRLQQDREDWQWMRKSFYVDTVASDGAYAYTDCTDTVSVVAIARFARWYQDCFKAYLSTDGVGTEYPLVWLDWETFRRIYRYGTQTDGKPVYVSMDPTQAFVLGPKPSAVYRVSGDYQIGPQIMTANADVPEMPTRFHDLIVYEAMVEHGFNSVAPEVIRFAQSEGTRLRAALELDQLPQVMYGAPLA